MDSFLEVLFLMFHLVFMIVYLKYVLCKLFVGSKVLCMLIKLVCSGISLKTTQDLFISYLESCQMAIHVV